MRNFFFTTGHGITSTSATAVANYSAEIKKMLLAKLNNISFLEQKCDIVGTDSTDKTVMAGLDDKKTRDLYNIAAQAVNCDKLNAWLREAVKYKNKLLEDLHRVSFNSYLKLNGIEEPELLECPMREDVVSYCTSHNIEMPEYPTTKTAMIDDIIDEMNAKEYAEYIGANSASAVFGNLIHDDGSVNEAREEYHKRVAAPYEVDDKLISHYIPTASEETVEKLFSDMQATQRAYNAEYNSLRNKLLKEQTARQRAANDEFQKAYEKYEAEVNRINDLAQAEYMEKYTAYVQSRQSLEDFRTKHREIWRQWIKDEEERISALKIIIPDSLQATYTAIEEKLHK